MNNNEKEIEEALKEPFDYGSEEYFKVYNKILAKREEYRRQEENNKWLKLAYFRKGNGKNE